MKKSIILFATVVILGVITWQLIQHKPDSRTSYDTGSSEFKVEEVAAIHRI